MPIPLAYLITFSCYGSRLHGDRDGSVDRFRNRPGTSYLPADPTREAVEQKRLTSWPYELDAVRREIVLKAIIILCGRRQWSLHAIHVRTKHLHLVVKADDAPERIMRDAKVAASSFLNKSGVDRPGIKRWTHHGSTRYLWKTVNVVAAVEYVLYQQGKPMAVWKPSEPRP